MDEIEFSKAINFYLAMGLLRREHIKYFDKSVRDLTFYDEDSTNRAKYMNDFINETIRRYIWRDTRIIKT